MLALCAESLLQPAALWLRPGRARGPDFPQIESHPPTEGVTEAALNRSLMPVLVLR